MSRGTGFIASVGALSAAQAAAVLGQLLALPVLARHLDPTEFGLAALATSVAAFANLFSDGGMGRSLIRTPLDRADEWSSVFWFLCAIGIVLTLALLALTPAVVWFFEKPGLSGPLAAMTALPFILAMNAAFAAEMEQRRAFAELAFLQVIATAVALAAAVAMAVAGFGVWALVAQQLIQVAFRAACVVIRSRFRPSLHFSREALGTHFIFGRNIVGASLTSFLGQQSTTLVVGKALSAADLGLFAMTQRFSRLPMVGFASPFGQVLYVRLIRAAEDDLGVFRETVLAAMRILCFVALPPVVALAVVGETAFTLVLSETWAPVAPVFAAIAIGAGLRAAIYPTSIALTALGLTGQRLRLSLEITAFWLIMLAATVSFGLVAVAAAQSVWMIAQTPRHWARLRPACGLGAKAFLGALAPGAATAGAVGGALLAADQATSFTGWVWLGVAAGISLLAYAAAAAVLLKRLRRDIARLRS